MKILLGDEYGLLKCVDCKKKIVDSKYGEMQKNNSIISLDSLYSSNNNIISVLHQYKFYILDWNKQIILSQPEFSLDFTKNKDIEFNSMNIIKNDTNNS